jgi:hypothetical protein
MPRRDDLAASGSLASSDHFDTACSASRCTPSPRSPIGARRSHRQWEPLTTTEMRDTLTVVAEGDQLGESVNITPASCLLRVVATAGSRPLAALCCAALFFRPPLIRPPPQSISLIPWPHPSPDLPPPRSQALDPLNQLEQRGATTPLRLPSHSQQRLLQASELAQATLAPPLYLPALPPLPPLPPEI